LEVRDAPWLEEITAKLAKPCFDGKTGESVLWVIARATDHVKGGILVFPVERRGSRGVVTPTLTRGDHKIVMPVMDDVSTEKSVMSGNQ